MFTHGESISRTSNKSPTYDLMRWIDVPGMNHEATIFQIRRYGIDADKHHLSLIDRQLFGNYPKGRCGPLRLNTAIVERSHAVANRLGSTLRQSSRRCESVRRYQHQCNEFVHCSLEGKNEKTKQNYESNHFNKIEQIVLLPQKRCIPSAAKHLFLLF